MKAIKYIIFLLLILVVGSSIYVAVQPNEYEVKRSRDMAIPAVLIFNHVIDFQTWEEWTIWMENRPGTEITYKERSKGVGGGFTWEDAKGSGIMETVKATPFERIEQDVQLGDQQPLKVIWNFDPDENGKTTVSWTISRKNIPFTDKALAVFRGGWDKMIGQGYERGLEKLDSLLTLKMKAYNITVNGITEYGGGFYLYKTTNATRNNISQKMSEQFEDIMTFTASNNIQPSGMPMSVYHEMNGEAGTVIMSNGIPVNEQIDTDDNSGILCGYIPKTRALKTTLLGNYNNLEKAWNEAMDYISEHKLVVSVLNPFEIYTNDPEQFPNPADWKTEIFIPLKD